MLDKIKCQQEIIRKLTIIIERQIGRKPYQNGINNSNQSKSNNFKNSKIEKKKIDLSKTTCYNCKSKAHYLHICQKIQSNNPSSNSNKSKRIFSFNVYTEVNNETNLLNTSGKVKE